MCSKLVTESELTKSASLLMSVPGISQSSAIHPLSAAINSVLMEINAGEFWELLVTGLVDVLKTEKLTELCGSTTDGFKVFLLSLLRSSENVWSSWVKKGIVILNLSGQFLTLIKDQKLLLLVFLYFE